MVLIVLTYSLSLFGTFITRTGVISSAHAFSKTALGPAFFAFIGFTFLGAVTILYLRWDTLKSEHSLESFLSCEAAFVLQNMLFLAVTFAEFWGTVFPLISELVTDIKITVGPPYFQRVTGPLFFALVLLVGIAPLLYLLTILFALSFRERNVSCKDVRLSMIYLQKARRLAICQPP